MQYTRSSLQMHYTYDKNEDDDDDDDDDDKYRSFNQSQSHHL